VEYGRLAALQIGPNKERQRVQAKLQEYSGDRYPDAECPEKYVTDWLRGRVVFASPTPLAVFFWFLLYGNEGMEVVSAKNKLLVRPDTDTSVNIHLNVRFSVQGEEHTAEVQLLLQNFVLAKDLEHKYFEFRRAGRPMEILAPIFQLSHEEEEDELQRMMLIEEERNPRISRSASGGRGGRGSAYKNNLLGLHTLMEASREDMSISIPLGESFHTSPARSKSLTKFNAEVTTPKGTKTMTRSCRSNPEPSVPGSLVE